MCPQSLVANSTETRCDPLKTTLRLPLQQYSQQLWTKFFLLKRVLGSGAPRKVVIGPQHLVPAADCNGRSLVCEFMGFSLCLCFHVESFLVSMRMWVFAVVLLTRLSPWWSNRIHGIISFFFYWFRLIFYVMIWSVLEQVSWIAE